MLFCLQAFPQQYRQITFVRSQRSCGFACVCVCVRVRACLYARLCVRARHCLFFGLFFCFVFVLWIAAHELRCKLCCACLLWIKSTRIFL